MSTRTLQPAVVAQVLPDSIAAELGFEPGDRLVSINGERPRDLIDYQFLCADEELVLEVLDSRWHDPPGGVGEGLRRRSGAGI
jgi:NifB/MoaA-like Fe-S oxidoreductase